METWCPVSILTYVQLLTGRGERKPSIEAASRGLASLFPFTYVYFPRALFHLWEMCSSAVFLEFLSPSYFKEF